MHTARDIRLSSLRMRSDLDFRVCLVCGCMSKCTCISVCKSCRAKNNCCQTQRSSITLHIKIIYNNRRAERAPHLSYSGEKSSSYIYICFLYIYIYIIIRSYVVHARATRKRRTGRLRFNGQYNRLKNGYFSSKL